MNFHLKHDHVHKTFKRDIKKNGLIKLMVKEKDGNLEIYTTSNNNPKP